MDPNSPARAGGEAASSRTTAGDPFMKVPVELHKAILNELNDRRDVFAIRKASPIMLKTTRGSHGILEQLLQTELGPAQLRTLLPDALAAVMFPTALGYPSDAAKKAAILQHLQDWKSNRLGDRASADDKVAAYAFMDRLAIPFAEDFAALTGTIDHLDIQIRLPAGAHKERPPRACSPAAGIWSYEPEERVRLLRAFCRFELLSKVIRARPGTQLFNFNEQIRLLNTFFEAWEVEEILWVQLYIGDMHTILFETHFSDIFDPVLSSIGVPYGGYNNGHRDFFSLHRKPFTNGYNDSHSDLIDDDETEWFTKTYAEADPGTPCAKFELAGHEKHGIFVKQTATFGLAFLKHFLCSDPTTYSYWIRAYGHVLLGSMADPDEAEYFGPLGARSAAHGGIPWLSFRQFDESQLDGNVATAVAPPQTNAYLAYGRARDTACKDGAANTAWRHLNATNKQLREAFRRCGWVFWSDARLRRSVFWNRRLDVFSPDSAPKWLYRPNGASISTPGEDNNEDDSHEYIVSAWEVNGAMRGVVNAPFRAPDLRSAAEAKLLSYLTENRARRDRYLFRDYPFNGFRRERVPLSLWENLVGGADPAVPAGTVEVFDGIFWG
ncbi:hypothetical protein LX32DRAFT_607899 [Colletotrichum zoysiae]|uniref:Uncharacterized protein n=1 Tax=Colletotrichum zoysiae TaxID=1216348 RepID=A0AAD9M651_9PEZI|nr:hypothetical protein LX32DRAFT_607899 [Colletotrichum zoysiae]